MGRGDIDQKELGQGDDISNLRPITLLVTELKILAKVLAKRLAPLVERLVRVSAILRYPEEDNTKISPIYAIP